MKKKRALLVLPAGEKAVKRAVKIANLFLSFPDWEVKYLSPTDKHLHDASVVVIPDTKGIYPFAGYFTGTTSTIKLQDPAIEEFRLKTLHYYVQKNIGIFGLGSSAYLTFAEVLGGKLDIEPGSGRLVYSGDIHKKAFFEGEKFYSQRAGALCAGMGDYEINEDLVAFIEEIFFCPPPEPAPVTVNTLKPQPVVPAQKLYVDVDRSTSKGQIEGP